MWSQQSLYSCLRLFSFFLIRARMENVQLMWLCHSQWAASLTGLITAGLQGEITIYASGIKTRWHCEMSNISSPIETKSQDILYLSVGCGCIFPGWGKTVATVIGADDGSTAQSTDSLTGLAAVTKGWLQSSPKNKINTNKKQILSPSKDTERPTQHCCMFITCSCFQSIYRYVVPVAAKQKFSTKLLDLTACSVGWNE